ncbi:MAG: DUF6624 domain-containing protein [Patescibacteria group bacterium]|mgnify:CR=1 FL=1
MIKNSKFSKEINQRVIKEQRLRVGYVKGKNSRPSFKVLDRQNTKWLKQVLRQNGWPTISLVGKKASEGAWLLTQHADQDILFQKKVLQLLKKAYGKNSRDIQKWQIAYLTDRILKNQKKSQHFGTQTIKDARQGKYYLWPVIDPKNLNKRRKLFNLITSEKYLTSINKNWAKYLKKPKYKKS